ncbi:MAG: hypothetical protein A2268_01405 [Candidatus Raymondbacteria bacterium RifOxyA12_full_50_37]|uniref:Secretion system C-terminal sorting domain-containing protein n=1 Tax=Candidatus Raymondbacteria bacterium RIFOXYD12_FULL_49_13 TaxID=1817890 RepID=A0A1F7FJD9_UNCRA|nr:MAG: hypothetical protein A2268_01405 [Candidatus Raymondbacteria bacterium RifOxyA12_full_50_37]OGJ87953.1 MAG: hypothetical protein A2248_01930 [Candidatus Raymondbacteria bacterium RIFOXYA2_FULL_49_16]OGJ88016.1 MAG: hypothetical protein A2350_00955 [Candidatus Raymondbacteria bacterium RifOxyB12_full_50_8]OGJ95620.1 MAG: hypothetical protein A2453_13100 [Candidatus Raymondbacteria bacterium RIFOXYC2_FULL_50_21]OGJ97638.1 MAG: hypothetical protein A2487_12970 [Candidatus Raymondbacteria b
MKKALIAVGVLAMSICTYAQLASGSHVYWYKATTNGYGLTDNPGPNLPANAFVHEGKIVTANNSTGLGYAGTGFSFGSNPLDNQGWCGVIFSGDLNNTENIGGSVDSAFIRGEYDDWPSGNGPLCNGGPVAIRCGVVDVSFGIMMWGSADAMPDDAVWADLDPMNTLSYDLTIAGAEEIINFTSPQGRTTGDASPLLDKQFFRVDVTDQVNYILQNISSTSAWAIVCLSQAGVGDTGKTSGIAGEGGGYDGMHGGTAVSVANVPWTTDGNTMHLLAYGSLAQVSVENEAAEVAGKIAIDNNPNPFNPTTTITYNTLGLKGMLKIFNSAGKVVYSNSVSGKGSTVWNAQNMSSGVYFSRLTVGNSVVSKRLILMK